MSVRNPPSRTRSLGSVSTKRLYRNLSIRLRGGEAPNEYESSKHHHNASPGYKSLWEAVENEDTLAVKDMLVKAKEDTRERKRDEGQRKDGELQEAWERAVNDASEEGLVPLDVAVLTHNSHLLHILIKAGARHNPVSLPVCSPPDWAEKLTSLVQLAGAKVEEWRELMLERPGSQVQAMAQRELQVWTLRRQLYCRMRDSFCRTVLPGPPSSVSLQVAGANSLAVSYRESPRNDMGLVSCFKVEWSTSFSFQPICGSSLVMAARNLGYIITGLESGVRYFVRVSAYNVKGWGPAQSSKPASAIPSSWQECSGIKLRGRNQDVGVKKVLEQIREPQYRGYCTESSRQPGGSKRQFLSRSLKHFFHSATKFVSLLQRGVYLAAVFYHKEKILVTSNNQLPMVEIQSCSTSVTQDFLWFAKLSCAWQQVPWLQQALSSSLSSSSSLLQSRCHILQAIAQLQSSLGTEDLGQVYFEPLKDKQGNVLLVTFKEYVPSAQCPDHLLHWAPLSCFKNSRSRTHLTQTPTAVDALTEQLKEKLSYHRRSVQKAVPGLYVGVLKLCSSVEQIRVLVPQKLPNLLCHARVRHNAHISREEWVWLQSLSVIGDHGPGTSADQEQSRPESTTPGDFARALRAAITQLLTKLGVPLHGARKYRVYTQELLQFGEDLSMLLLLPHSEDFCASPRPAMELRDLGLTLPLQIFELVHFWTYKRDFLSQYCQAWVRLELDSHLSQQALREALDGKEIQEARERLSHVTRFSQTLDEIWREVRWITDVLQCVRSKQASGMAPLALVMGDESPAKAANQHETHQKEGTFQPSLTTPVSRRESQRYGPVPEDGAGSNQEGAASSEDDRKGKAEGGYLVDEDQHHYNDLSTQSVVMPAVRIAACRSMHASHGGRSLFATECDAFVQQEGHKSGDSVTGRVSTYDGFSLGNNKSDISYSLGEPGLLGHRSQPQSESSKDTSRHTGHYTQLLGEMDDCQAPADKLYAKTSPGFQDSDIHESLGDMASLSIPGHFLLSGGVPCQAGRGRSLPARSLVEWVSSATPHHP